MSYCAASYYIVQVAAGQEDSVCRTLLTRAAAAGATPSATTGAVATGAARAAGAVATGAAAAGATPSTTTSATPSATACVTPSATAAGKPFMRQAFVPKAYMGKKLNGVWVQVPQALLPGYFVVETEHPDKLAQLLRHLNVFARILKENITFKPLNEADMQWIKSFTRGGKDPLEISEGYIEDGILHVTSGPLLGREAWVVKISHRKKLAYLQIDAFGRQVKAQIGIRITRKKPNSS